MKLLILLLTVIAVGTVSTTSAVSYDTVSIRLTENPQFCVFSEDVRFQTLTFLALHSWEKQLTMANPVDWKTDLDSVSTLDLNKCDVIVQFVDNMDNPLNLGKTDLNEAEALITVPLYSEGKKLPTQDILNVLTHEIGHSMGLGHYDSGVLNDKDSIMSPQFEPFKNIILEIMPIDIMKMIEIYPEGFQ